MPVIIFYDSIPPIFVGANDNMKKNDEQKIKEKWGRGGKTARLLVVSKCRCKRGVAMEGTEWMDLRSDQLKGMILGV